MTNRVAKKIGDATLKSIYKGLERRTNRTDVEVGGSINMDRTTEFIRYKASKSYALTNYGMKLDDFESVKEYVWDTLREITKEDAATVAYDTMLLYSLPRAMDQIAEATFRASKFLNGRGGEKRKWGNLADFGFKPARTFKESWRDLRCWEREDHIEYVQEFFGVKEMDFRYLIPYAKKIFPVKERDAIIMAIEAIVIERIVEAAFKASHTLHFDTRKEQPSEPIDAEYHQEKISFAEDEAVDPQIKTGYKRAPYLCLESLGWLKPWKAGFMEGRDEKSIFMDSDEALAEYKQSMIICWATSSCTLNWGRIARFMEYKARKEFALETYGVKLGDFQSLKNIAFKLFDITEAEAENLASETMDSDSNSIAFEKIADAAFKASKILNWTDGNKSHKKTWHGSIADATGFKSFKSFSNYCKGMTLEARKAYTMEAFGVDSVDVDYIKDFVILSYTDLGNLQIKEEDAVIMACQAIAIDKVVDAVSQNLNLSVPLVDSEEVREAKANPICGRFYNSYIPVYR